MNPRTRKAALHAIGTIAILASVNALAHSYAGLYDWAVYHRLGGWQAMSWPAEIDVFLAGGELALYVAYLDGWPARQRMWPWATALTGLAVSVAGNVGHIQALPGHPVILANRLTAAASPLAAFAGLSVGLLVVKMTRRKADVAARAMAPTAALALAEQHVVSPEWSARDSQMSGPDRQTGDDLAGSGGGAMEPDPGLLDAASAIYQDAAARGERLSQRMLARQLRGHGHGSQRAPAPDRRQHRPDHRPGSMTRQQPHPRRRIRESLQRATRTDLQCATRTERWTGVEEISGIMTRLRDAASLPDTLAVAFDAFEVIRQLARDCESRVPALFAAFMTTADAAVDGREAVTTAPALPQPRAATPRRGRAQRPGHAATDLPASRSIRPPRHRRDRWPGWRRQAAR